jgi:hypothetical protein
MNTTVQSFPWSHFLQWTLILTLASWACFFFYDYFILGSKVQDDIYHNPLQDKSSGVDTREQIQTKQVEFDSLLNNP